MDTSEVFAIECARWWIFFLFRFSCHSSFSVHAYGENSINFTTVLSRQDETRSQICFNPHTLQKWISVIISTLVMCWINWRTHMHISPIPELFRWLCHDFIHRCLVYAACFHAFEMRICKIKSGEKFTSGIGRMRYLNVKYLIRYFSSLLIWFMVC